LLQVENLNLKIDGTTLFDNLSFKIEDENTYAVFLADGKGKTLLSSILCGAADADSGEVVIDGKLLTSDDAEMKSKIGYYSSDIKPLGFMSVYEILELYGAARGADNDKIKRQIEEALELCELEGLEGRSVSSLDALSKARLGIALSLMGKPNLLVYDDIFKGLDAQAADSVAELLELISQKKRTILVCGTPSLAARVCTHAIFINDGKAVLCDSIENIENEINKTQEMSLSVRGVSENVREKLLSMPEVIRILSATELDGIVTLKIEHTRDEKIKDKLFEAMSEISAPILSYEENILSITDVFYSITKSKRKGESV